jgi:hypothetical protein
MEKLLNLGEAHIDLGENKFLTHLTHEIKIENKVIGHAMLTLYEFKKASREATAWKWLAPKDSYLSNYETYLFDKSFSIPVLPNVFLEDAGKSEKLIIIDEITLEPFFQGRRLESYILNDILVTYEKQCDITLLSGHKELGKRMGYSDELAAVMYCQLGFIWIDDRVGAKFKSVPIDDLDEIKELVIDFQAII